MRQITQQQSFNFMPINKNHEFEELNGTKCAIVEKNIPAERAQFLRHLLQANGYTVVVVAAAPPKAAQAAIPPADGQGEVAPLPPPPPTLFTVGVTDVTFNPTNAVFGRMLKTQDGRVVTLAYWYQKEPVAQEDIPYFERKI
jgi:hypothetical protein